MAELFYDKNADLNRIKARPHAIIGFGSQGHAHALSLKDSGVDVRVGLYKGSKSWAKAEAAGLKVQTVSDACAEAQTIMILTPDTAQAALYREAIAAAHEAGQDADVRPRLHHSLRPNRAAEGRRRFHDRPQGPRPSGA